MTANRVDQITVPIALRDHDARIRALEAVPPPLPGAGLPPWVEYTPGLGMYPNPGDGVEVAPTSVGFGEAMIQTVDGLPYPTGSPLGNGTVIGCAHYVLTDGGSMPVGSTGPGSFGPTLPLLTQGVDGNTDPFVIGHGYIEQASTKTIYEFELLSDWSMLVPGIPDTTAPAGAENLARLANTHLTPSSPAWPWVWASGDIVNVTYVYRITGDI